MQPVGKLCNYTDIIDGSLDLADVASMIDVLLVRADNEELANRVMKDGRTR